MCICLYLIFAFRNCYVNLLRKKVSHLYHKTSINYLKALEYYTTSRLEFMLNIVNVFVIVLVTYSLSWKLQWFCVQRK